MAYELERFKIAQTGDYKIALDEIKRGKKRTHWIWYIFPQLVELGFSSTAKKYGIRGKAEALAYIEDELLRNRLIEISEALFSLESKNATEVMGHPDDLKLKSCMTLFYLVAPEYDVFRRILDKFYAGSLDENTVKLLDREITLDEVFLIEPEQWGLRGDPVVWEEMKNCFRNETIPLDSDELQKMLCDVYKNITGHNLDQKDDKFYFDSLDKGGMSGGYVLPQWWQNEGIPFILKNARRLSASLEEK